ncbi:MAG: hypothetical protein GX815_02980 [Clostridiales bacterium]|nr:hypothetical protein [Clostridiales bacterium]
MRKIFPFILLLSLIFTSTVQASPVRNEDFFSKEYIDDSGLADQGIQSTLSVDWGGDTCYVYMDDRSIFTYKEGEGLEKLCHLPQSPIPANQSVVVLDQTARDQLQKIVTNIVAGENMLYGFNVYNGKFGSIDREGIHWADVILDMSGLNPNDEMFPNRVVRSFLTAKNLYTLVFTEYGEFQFFGFDRNSGKATEYQIEGAVNAYREDEGKFLFLCRTDEEYKISRLEIETGIVKDIPLSMSQFPISENVGGFAYDKEIDSFFVAMKGRVFRSNSNGEFESIAYIPTEVLLPETPAWTLSGSRYVMRSMTGMYVRSESYSEDRKELVIRTNIWTPNAETKFKQAYPEYNLNFIRGFVTAEEVSQLLITRDDSVDIFEVSADFFYSALVRKEFAADLSSSSVIQNEVASMDTRIVSAITNGRGNIIAYPSQLRLWSTDIHEGYWGLVFGEHPLPANMHELLDAWIAWEELYADIYEDLVFITGYDYAQYCQSIITFYIQQNDTPEGDINLNHPDLKEALSKLRQINEIREQSGRLLTHNNEAQQENVASILRFRAWNQAMNKFSTSGAMTSENTIYDMYQWNYSNLPIVFSTGDQPQTDASLFVYIVNPFSRNIDDAIKYIEKVSEMDSEPYIYYAVHPQCTEPYEWPDFQQLIESYVQQKEQLEEVIKGADNMDSPDIRDIQAIVDYMQHYIENQENERWMISEHTMQNQRKSLESLNLHQNTIYLGAPGSTVDLMIAELCQRYADGNMTMDDLLNELARKVSLMELENE